MKILGRISISHRALARPRLGTVPQMRPVSSDSSDAHLTAQHALPTAPSTRYISPTYVGAPSTATTEILARGATYLLPVYDRPPFVLSHGKGSYVWDTEGRKYIDFSAGIAVNALGHADEGVLKVGSYSNLELGQRMRPFSFGAILLGAGTEPIWL
jgi:acetylornithine aminotransferase